MDEHPEKKEESTAPLTRRPFLLTIVCLFSFSFFGFISALFLLSCFYSGRITEVLNKYRPEDTRSKGMMALFLLGGFLLHVSSLTGSVMIWKMKRTGYYLFSVSALIISAYQLLQANIYFTSTLVYIILVVLFGIFFKRYR